MHTLTLSWARQKRGPKALLRWKYRTKRFPVFKAPFYWGVADVSDIGTLGGRCRVPTPAYENQTCPHETPDLSQRHWCPARVALPDRTERNKYFFKWLISTPNSSIRACLFTKCLLQTLKMAVDRKQIYAGVIQRNAGLYLDCQIHLMNHLFFALWTLLNVWKVGSLSQRLHYCENKKATAESKTTWVLGFMVTYSTFNLLGGGLTCPRC